MTDADGEALLVGVTDGVTDGVFDGVNVIDMVTDGVIDTDGEALLVGVTDGVTEGVRVGVTLGFGIFSPLRGYYLFICPEFE